MSKPKQWKQGRELKHADAWESRALGADERFVGVASDEHEAELRALINAYPQEAEQPDRLWVGSGDSGVVS